MQPGFVYQYPRKTENLNVFWCFQWVYDKQHWAAMVAINIKLYSKVFVEKKDSSYFYFCEKGWGKEWEKEFFNRAHVFVNVFFRLENSPLKNYKNHIFCDYRRIIFALQLKTSKRICWSVRDHVPYFSEHLINKCFIITMFLNLSVIVRSH